MTGWLPVALACRDAEIGLGCECASCPDHDHAAALARYCAALDALSLLVTLARREVDARLDRLAVVKDRAAGYISREGENL